MAKSGFTVVRPLPSPQVLTKQIRNRMRANLMPLGRRMAQQHNDIVSGWRVENRPQFRARITFSPTAGTATIGMIILNSSKRIANGDLTIRQLFTMWDITGSRPHIITPRGEGYPLSFQVDGQWVHTYHVNHPGTKPEKKTPEIYEQAEAKINPLLVKSVQEGMWP